MLKDVEVFDEATCICFCHTAHAHSYVITATMLRGAYKTGRSIAIRQASPSRLVYLLRMGSFVPPPTQYCRLSSPACRRYLVLVAARLEGEARYCLPDAWRRRVGRADDLRSLSARTRCEM